VVNLELSTGFSATWVSEETKVLRAAKAGLDEPITDMKYPVNDLLTCVNQLCAREWQTLCSQCTSNKLCSVQSVIGHHTKISSL